MTDFLEALPHFFSMSTLVILGMTLVTLAALSWVLWMTQRFVEQTRLAQQNILASVLTDVQEAAILVDANGIVDFLNPAAEKMLKFKVRSARGKFHRDLFTLLEPLTHSVLGWLEAARKSDRPLLHHALLNASGLKDVKVTYTVQAIEYEGVRQPLYLLLLRDQTELYAMQVSLEHVREHDPHTMLLNRKGFEVRLKHALDQVERHGVKHVFCLVAMDQFKLVNDTMGHSGGDVLIERIVDMLKASLNPATDILARLGGDEFGILFRGVEPKMAIRTVEQIRSRLENYDFEWSKKHLKITASIAFVPLFKSEDAAKRGRLTVAKVLSLADAACRVAKNKGGNRIQLYKANDQDILRQHGNLVWVEKLKKAFESSNFRLVAQPIHNLHPLEFAKPFSHYEVLVRLYDENNQPIPPDEFIPAAEAYSMMPRLDRWVVKQLIQALRQISQKVPVPVFAVNLSGQSLDEPAFLQFVLDEIKAAALNPAMLCFEITERVAIHNLELAQQFVETLKGLGCSFSLDDFGTGVSSFSYLKSLAVDYLKIDGSFIKDIANDHVAHEMVRSVNQVGHLMGVKVIAEYVENERVIQILREIGVDYGQGYGISKPIPLEDAVRHHSK